MNESRLAGKVGLFVVLGLIVLALMLLSFSKGASLFTPTFTLRLRANSVGGLKDRSEVHVSGVKVGFVGRTELAPDGRGVTILLKIHQKYEVHADARFAIEQVGFLGDQFVAIYPAANTGRRLQDGDEVTCEDPFNMQEAARAALGFIKRVDDTARMLNDAIKRVDKFVLNEHTLTNLSAAVENVRLLSERGRSVVDGLGHLVDTNTSPVNQAVTNLVHFSKQLNKIAGEFGEVLMTNRADITLAVQDVKSIAHTLKDLVAELESGKGLAGGLIKDEQLKQEAANTLTHLAILSRNLDIASSNLNQNGLWWMLWKHKPAATNWNPPPKFPLGKK
jgi:phospholipid/cholesterol/gamma-HCH transport system substrate-binding protein